MSPSTQAALAVPFRAQIGASVSSSSSSPPPLPTKLLYTLQLFSPGGPVRKPFHMVLALLLGCFFFKSLQLWVAVVYTYKYCCVSQLLKLTLYHIIPSHLFNNTNKKIFSGVDDCTFWNFLPFLSFFLLLLNDWVLNWMHLPQWWSSLRMRPGRHPTYRALWETRTDW